ncbi:MAG: type II CRISPR-associated endonuclease Cas1 [Candidatus Gastranaerophilales bacterium]|nr:type II CRISPR-associated endonuclease Cas1 [Candidatus Gastranaerophilales bacterium]
MGYKTLLFTNPCKLKVKNKQLCCQFKDSEDVDVTIPLEDISTIILDNFQIEVTNYLISMCGEYNITMFSCSSKHQPNIVLNPFYQHSRNTKISLNQINMAEPFKKRIWQKIVKQKIKNQSYVLRILFDYNDLEYFCEKVKSGDTTNIESQAARKYWGILFENFKRHDQTKHNAALDYGYAIIRGTLSKFTASSGLIPCIGIHHCNELNSFNLVEDLIEAFRPIVDLAVAKMNTLESQELSKSDRGYLLNILNNQCRYKNESISVQNACERICQTFVKSMEQNNVKMLELPKFIGGK